MLELRRTVRFCLSDGSPAGGAGGAEPALATPVRNGYSAWPAIRGLGRYYELHVTCRGEADPVTGYFLNIKKIDEAVREHVLPDLEAWVSPPSNAADAPLGEVMQRIMSRLDEHLQGKATEASLQLTPTVSLTIRNDDMDRVTLRQQFEFSAAHRLHVPTLSDEENRETFGKCNNPAGHGHNYRLEVAVSVPIDPHGHVLTVEEFDAIVDRHAVQKLDHKHLNLDLPEFHQPGGLNPSVENIAKVAWGMLVEKFADAGSMGGVELEEVRVWETEKTMCIYRGEEAARV